MVQQISAAASVPLYNQQSKVADTTDRGKIDSFQSLLRATQSRADKTEHTENGGKKPKSEDKLQKDEKDAAKDAAALAPVEIASADRAPAVLCQPAENPDTAKAMPKASVDPMPATQASAQKVMPQPPETQQIPVQTSASAQAKQSAQPVPAELAITNAAVPQSDSFRQNVEAVSTPKSAKAQSGTEQIATDHPQTKTAEAIPQEAVRNVRSSTENTVKTLAETIQPETRNVTAEKVSDIKLSEENKGREEVTGTDLQPKKEMVSAADSTAAAGTQKLTDLYTDGKVVVRVADASGKAKVPVTHQITNAVAEGLKAGKQQLTLDLYPQSLGKLSIKLVSEGGMLTVEIAASNPRTQDLLASGSEEIKSLLHSSTGQEIQVNTPNQSSEQYSQQQNGYAEQNARQQEQEQQQASQQRTRWLVGDGMSSVSTGDFLSILKQANQ